jgi:imidazoleglycerol phosphate synthase glutamine amidotransferase subunit HisH
MYHVHTFAPRPRDEDDVLGAATYGSEFVSAVQRPPVYGVQFHPEKSGPHGLQLLAGFVRARVAA